ncbi:MAG: peptidoglycan DD-metalloendopeptidase family protein [Bacteroidales bacterium]|nr:peptidoglycan DD-metalloendopeptidase family protein [Bacteroidales bacterium]
MMKNTIKRIAIFLINLLLINQIFAVEKDTCQQYKKDIKKCQKIAKQLQMLDEDNYYYTLPVFNKNYKIDSTADWYQTLSNITYRTRQYIRTKNNTFSDCPCMSRMYSLLGQSLYYSKKYSSALDAFFKILKDQDTNLAFETKLFIIDCEQALEHYESAEFQLNELINETDTSILNHNIHFLCTAADLYIEMEQWNDAINMLKTICEQNNYYVLKTRAEFIIGQIYEQQKQYSQAINQYKIVANRATANNVMHSYAIVHQRLCQEDIAQHIRDSIAEELYHQSLPSAFEPSVVESSFEHNNFENEYPYYFNDVASMFFLQEYDDEDFDDYNYIDDINDDELNSEMLASIFENWDSVSIHIPKTDFSQMQDTIYLQLVPKNYTLPPYTSLVSKFGWRRRRYHYGVDTRNAMRDSIYCLFDGVVRIATRNKSYGNVVIVRHYNGMETFYAHACELLVEPNEKVKAGQVIALVGSTGRSTGPHLHLETRYKGVPINPEYIIDFENHKLRSDTLLICKETFNYKKSNYSSHTSSSTGSNYYVVRHGDTLSSIAARHHTSVSSLKRLNGLRSDFIREGQKLKLK